MQDTLMLAIIGFSNGHLKNHYMGMKPAFSEVFRNFQDKAGLLRSMAHHFGVVVGIMISVLFILT
jgi:hypothetical protein